MNAIREIDHEPQYAPRTHQRLVHSRLKRFNCLVCHRGFGKSVLTINQLIASGLKVPHTAIDPTFIYVAPFRQQAEAVAWNALKHYSEPYRDEDPNIAKLSVRLRTGAQIRLFGADNPDAIRGIHPHGAAFDEFGDMNPDAWHQVVRPALSTHKGFAVFIGTPKGQNAFHDIYTAAMKDDEWYAAMFKASETGIIPQSELDSSRKGMTEEEYAQEFECSFQAPNVGAYYGKEIAAAETEQRILRVPWEPAVPVTTAWDLGMDDATAIWFVQQVGREVRVIDYYEASGEGLTHYVAQLRNRPYVYADHLLPHDAAVKELGTGVSRLETLRSLGLNVGEPLAAQRVEDGINAVRLLLPRCYFDAVKCEKGLKALRHYQREWAPKLGTWRASPRHDWASHCFTGNTLILTRYGIRQIMDLPPTGEVLTPCGWKQYRNPRITRRNAQLVEVRFTDGLSVRCTPDHLFKTESGWKSAASLAPNTAIQSTLTRSRSILMAAYTGFGRARRISRGAAKSFIARLGNLLLDPFRMDAISIIGMGMLATTPSITLNVSRPRNTLDILLTSACAFLESRFQKLLATPPPHGTALLPGGYGINGMLSAVRVGKSGNVKKGNAPYARLSSIASSAKAAIRKSIAAPIAKPLHIASVVEIFEPSDVWCLTVPDAECFSLANGAVVHNCADAFRYLAMGLRPVTTGGPLKYPKGGIV